MHWLAGPGREPRREMTAADVLDLVGSFEGAGIDVWLDGGWAVDAVMETQTRPSTRFGIPVPETYRRPRETYPLREE